jgi:hypothetical protein
MCIKFDASIVLSILKFTDTLTFPAPFFPCVSLPVSGFLLQGSNPKFLYLQIIYFKSTLLHQFHKPSHQTLNLKTFFLPISTLNLYLHPGQTRILCFLGRLRSRRRHVAQRTRRRVSHSSSTRHLSLSLKKKLGSSKLGTARI